MYEENQDFDVYPRLFVVDFAAIQETSCDSTGMIVDCWFYVQKKTSFNKWKVYLCTILLVVWLCLYDL